MFHAASLTSLLVFLAICVGVVSAFIVGVWTSARHDSMSPRQRTLPVAVGTVVWLASILFVVRSGWLEGNEGRVLFFAGAMNAVSLGVGLSPIGGWLSRLPLPALVAFQGFRLPLELVLHSWVAQGVIPAT